MHGPIDAARLAAAERAAVRAEAARRRTDIVTHAILALGVVLFALPIWIVLMGSTHDVGTIARGEVPLLPGPHAVENYLTALGEGSARTTRVPVALMMLNSLVMALLITVGKIAISLASAYAVVFFSFPGGWWRSGRSSSRSCCRSRCASSRPSRSSPISA